MTLVPLPALADKYIWMLQEGRHAIEVDPQDARPRFDAPGRAPLQLAAILVTRPAPDHTRAVPGRREPTAFAAAPHRWKNHFR